MYILPLLGAILVILNLVGTISLPWVWALAPFWVPLAAWLAVIALMSIVAGIAALVFNFKG